MVTQYAFFSVTLKPSAAAVPWVHRFVLFVALQMRALSLLATVSTPLWLLATFPVAKTLPVVLQTMSFGPQLMHLSCLLREALARSLFSALSTKVQQQLQLQPPLLLLVSSPTHQLLFPGRLRSSLGCLRSQQIMISTT
jgi:hypothetical protein